MARKWEELDIDVLVQIMQSYNIFDLTSIGIAQVCSTWRMAACDPMLWKTLNLTPLKSHYIKIPLEPYVYVGGESDKAVSRVLKIALSLSHGNTTTLLCHFELYLSDEQLTYVAERTPRLKRLVLPAWNRIKKTGIVNAIRKWPELESLTMPCIGNPAYLMEAISNNSPNFSELKVMGPFDIRCASALVAYIPMLKVLSVRCSIVFKNALIAILEGLQFLEVLNVSHSIIMEDSPTVPRKTVVKLDSFILERATRLRKFIVCSEKNCAMCETTRADEGLVRWRNHEDLWKEDEVTSLAV